MKSEFNPTMFWTYSILFVMFLGLALWTWFNSPDLSKYMICFVIACVYMFLLAKRELDK